MDVDSPVEASGAYKYGVREGLIPDNHVWYATACGERLAYRNVECGMLKCQARAPLQAGSTKTSVRTRPIRDWALILIALLGVAQSAASNDLTYAVPGDRSDERIGASVRKLAERELAQGLREKREHIDQMWLYMAARRYGEALSVLKLMQAEAASSDYSPLLPMELYARAMLKSKHEREFEARFQEAFRDEFGSLGDAAAMNAAPWLAYAPIASFQQRLSAILDRQADKTKIASSEAVELCKTDVLLRSYRAFAPLTTSLIAEDESRRYIVQDDVIIHTEQGATLSAIVVRPRAIAGNQPAALFSAVETVVPRMLQNAKYAASRGYVGVSSDTHGKRLSPDEIVLFEHDAEDIYGVIDWIRRQAWSDGQVGMYGGSNAGFTQWAAAKTLHPALKTIVPYTPLDPGYGLPMNNNVFITANYDMPFYLANTKYVDANYTDRNRYASMLEQWYRSGRPFREIDQVDGRPNPWLQRWLRHPAYDEYWQSLTANGRDYARLNIPILAIDGYYDDGHNNAVRRLREHYSYKPDAEHYLVIGPYDHFDVQGSMKSPVLRGYPIDPVANLDTPALTFQWFDYVMKHGTKPALLRDRINYQVMGKNVWRHAASIEKMSDQVLTFYLTDRRAGAYYELAASPPTSGSVEMTVDFKDRATVGANTYPSEILTRNLQPAQGLTFVSPPIDAPLAVSGMFSAKLRFRMNKKDFDVAMALYEALPTGEFFHLSDTVARASYANDMSRRELFTPQQVYEVTFDRTLLVSRQLHRGSRLLLMIDINRGPGAQVNYGTGRDVSDESIADAKEPLIIEWLHGSSIRVPMQSDIESTNREHE